MARSFGTTFFPYQDPPGVVNLSPPPGWALRFYQATERRIYALSRHNSGSWQVLVFLHDGTFVQRESFFISQLNAPPVLSGYLISSVPICFWIIDDSCYIAYGLLKPVDSQASTSQLGPLFIYSLGGVFRRSVMLRSNVSRNFPGRAPYRFLVGLALLPGSTFLAFYYYEYRLRSYVIAFFSANGSRLRSESTDFRGFSQIVTSSSIGDSGAFSWASDARRGYLVRAGRAYAFSPDMVRDVDSDIIMPFSGNLLWTGSQYLLVLAPTSVRFYGEVRQPVSVALEPGQQFQGFSNRVQLFDVLRQDAAETVSVVAVGIEALQQSTVRFLDPTKDLDSQLRSVTWIPRSVVPALRVGDIIVPHQQLAAADIQSIPNAGRLTVQGFSSAGGRAQTVFAEGPPLEA